MRKMCMTAGFVLSAIVLTTLGAADSDAAEGSKYLDAVRTFGDNVLKYGRDTYGPKHTPLFVDGLNIHTHEPVKWIAPNGDRWILSNFASQQTLMRTLDGLSSATGDIKYRRAAMDAIQYAFDHLRTPNGLFYWGHVTAYDALGEKPRGTTLCESIKLHYPYYELMWTVDTDATKKLIEALWCTHVIDWSNLDMDRIGYFDDSLEEPWNHEYKAGPTFFKSKRGALANSLTGSSLVHAGIVLYKLSAQEQPLVWSKRLVNRFVDTRHPKTGISAVVYNNTWLPVGEDMKEHLVDPYTAIFPWDIYEHRYLYYPESAQAHPWISILLAGRTLGETGKDFTRWALEEFTAWGKASYRERDNSFVPMLTNGMSLEGYVWKNGPGKSSGLNVIKPYPADMSFFWAYSLAYCMSGDAFMWEIVRDIARGNHLGDVGQTPTHTPELRTNTASSHAYGLLGFLELYEKTGKREYLEMAQRIGDNILLNQFHRGFFVPSGEHLYARFNCVEALALLHLDMAMRGSPVVLPQAWPELPLFIPAYRHKEEGVDRRVIYALTESSEPPFSLQEAAAIGDVNLVRSLIDIGKDVNGLDDSLLKTALHRATISGHKDLVVLLLAKGADIDARDHRRQTPLHYAVDKGDKETAGLLIAKGADVNAKNKSGDTPLHIAVRAGYKDIVGLLIAKGADVNVRNSEGFTPLHCVAMRPRPSTPWWKALLSSEDPIRDMAELLISKGADVKATDNEGRIPIWWARRNSHRGLVALLREHETKER